MHLFNNGQVAVRDNWHQKDAARKEQLQHVLNFA